MGHKMQHLAAEKFQEMIEAGHETRNLEFKQSFAWNDPDSAWIQEKVIRTVLGMANTRDGGTIVIGVPETNGVPDLTVGLTAEQHASYERYDDIKAIIDSYGSNVSFNLTDATHDGRAFVVFNVREFALAPSICRRNSPERGGAYVLREGDVYVRALAGPESTIRARDTEMAEIIQLAVDKGAQNLRGRGWEYTRGAAEDGFVAERGNF